MQNTFDRPSRRARIAAWAALVVVPVLALAWVAIPVFTIMPFKAQTPAGLELSYTLRRWSPWATLLAAGAAVALAVWVWRRRAARRWWTKALTVVALVPAFVALWFAHQNHFEWMFKPLARSAYAKAAEAAFVADKEMVMAVEVNGDAVAYPVRQLAYHHVVQDTVGGTPLVATY